MNGGIVNMQQAQQRNAVVVRSPARSKKSRLHMQTPESNDQRQKEEEVRIPSSLLPFLDKNAEAEDIPSPTRTLHWSFSEDSDDVSWEGACARQDRDEIIFALTDRQIRNLARRLVAVVLLALLLSAGASSLFRSHQSDAQKRTILLQKQIKDLEIELELNEKLATLQKQLIEHKSRSISAQAPDEEGRQNAQVRPQKHSDDAPRVAPACSSTASYIIYAYDYGAAGDGVKDDSAALQRAVDAAKPGGNTVVLHRGVFFTSTTLSIPEGVEIKGQGQGSSPTAIAFGADGTVIAYCGSEHAVKMVGHSSSLRNIAIYDWKESGYPRPREEHCECASAAGGVLVEADNARVESTSLTNVLLYGFGKGAALTLSSLNRGGIAHSIFKDVRIRHAQIGVLLKADASSFVNSNAFSGCSISGKISQDTGIRSECPGECENNTFHGVVIDPPWTEPAYVYVTRAKNTMRLEEF